MNDSLKQGTLLSERYHILARLGEGGFGAVYKARDKRKHGKLVAIKEINMATLSTREKIDVTDSFNREITLLSQLQHKNLPHIHNYFTDPEHWYIVMDYIEGETLEDLLARLPKGKLSVRQATKIGTTLCDVLSYLHNQHPPIIFRDVKPGNIMLTPWGKPYLIDFGIARRYRKGQTRDTGSLGSPGYAAPEQYGRTQTTVQTDIYGLGATLQTLITGKEPMEICLQGIPADIRIPDKLQLLINRMIDPNPLMRPHSMADVRRSLSRSAISSRWGSWLLSQLWIIYQFMYHSSPTYTPFVELYLLLALVAMLGYSIFAVVRSWQTVPTGLSIKAALLIIWQGLLSSWVPISALTICISLLYAILARPSLPGPTYIFLWIYVVALILIALPFLMLWLNENYVQPRRQAQKQTQVAPLQQQTQKYP